MQPSRGGWERAVDVLSRRRGPHLDRCYNRVRVRLEVSQTREKMARAHQEGGHAGGSVSGGREVFEVSSTFGTDPPPSTSTLPSDTHHVLLAVLNLAIIVLTAITIDASLPSSANTIRSPLHADPSDTGRAERTSASAADLPDGGGAGRVCIMEKQSRRLHRNGSILV